MIAYSLDTVTWHKADKIVGAPNGYSAIVLLTGRYLTVDPNGTFRDADSIGPFESAKQDGRFMSYSQYSDYGHPDSVVVLTTVQL